MKIYILCLLTLIISTLGISQVSIDNNTSKYTPKLSQQSVDDVKKNKTYFVVMDLENADQYKMAVRKSWTISDYDFIDYNQFLKMRNNNSVKGSFFVIDGMNRTMVFKRKNIDNDLYSESSRTNFIHTYLFFWTKLNEESTNIARVELHPNRALRDKILGLDISGKGDPEFLNLTPGMYRIFVKLINDYLSKDESRGLFVKEDDKQELELLKKDTLFISEHILSYMNKMNGKEHQVEAKELFSKYPYAYKVVTQSELSDMILNATKPLYVLDYVRSNAQKLITIYNAFIPKIVYSTFQSMSYNIKDKDLAEIF